MPEFNISVPSIAEAMSTGYLGTASGQYRNRFFAAHIHATHVAFECNARSCTWSDLPIKMQRMVINWTNNLRATYSSHFPA